LELFYLSETKNYLTKKHPHLFLLLVMLFSFVFQLSILFFSRSGVSVLIHRIIDPELNGYFTAALSIHNLSDFLRNYNQTMLHFVYHAKAHPPGAILLFFFIKQLLSFFPSVVTFANHFNPNHSDIKLLWNTLSPLDRTTAIFSSFFIPFLSTISLVPLYSSAKILYGTKVATRSLFLFSLVPTIVFFIPINDCFLHIFSITAFFFLVKALQTKRFLWLLLSGFVLFLGAFFNLSLLPIGILFTIFFFLSVYQHHKKPLLKIAKGGIFFALGFLLLPLFLLIVFHFNFLQVTQTIMKHVPDIHTRSYTIWIFYNLYDFFVFSGIPITIIFLTEIKQLSQNNLLKQITKIDPLFLAFLLMILILNFSGSVRGETGRLWSPYTPFLILLVTNVITTKKNFATKFFAGFLLLQAIQILVMQEFWVMLW